MGAAARRREDAVSRAMVAVASQAMGAVVFRIMVVAVFPTMAGVVSQARTVGEKDGFLLAPVRYVGTSM